MTAEGEVATSLSEITEQATRSFENTTDPRLREILESLVALPGLGLIAREMGPEVVKTVGIWSPDKVFEEIRKTVHGYDVAMPVIAT